jgi:hypothetical protein
LFFFQLLQKKAILLALQPLRFFQTRLLSSTFCLYVCLLLLQSYLQHLFPLFGFLLLKFVELFDEVLVVGNNFEIALLRLD